MNELYSMTLEDRRVNILNYGCSNFLNNISNKMCRIQQDKGLRHGSLWVPGLNSRQVHVGLVVDKVDWDTFYCKHIGCPVSVSFHQHSILITNNI